jgi:hypothetical protein
VAKRCHAPREVRRGATFVRHLTCQTCQSCDGSSLQRRAEKPTQMACLSGGSGQSNPADRQLVPGHGLHLATVLCAPSGAVVSSPSPPRRAGAPTCHRPAKRKAAAARKPPLLRKKPRASEGFGGGARSAFGLGARISALVVQTELEPALFRHSKSQRAARSRHPLALIGAQLSSKARVRNQWSSALPSGWPSRSHSA